MEIREIFRGPAPGVEPLGVAFVGRTLWIACRESHRLYAVDPAAWIVAEEVPAPGAPFGIAAAADGLRVVIGFGDDDDDRYVYRFVNGRGFASDRIACPDLSGAHVAVDGEHVLVSQAHNMQLVSMDEAGTVLRALRLDRVPLGLSIVAESLYLITGGTNFRNLQLSRLETDGATARLSALATIPFAARGLAYDGSHFWTAQRDSDEIVAFELPIGALS